MAQSRITVLETGISARTASITKKAVADLGLKVGDDACAIIKASDLLVAK
jgi:molybdopterin-binding protein